MIGSAKSALRDYVQCLSYSPAIDSKMMVEGVSYLDSPFLTALSHGLM